MKDLYIFSLVLTGVFIIMKVSKLADMPWVWAFSPIIFFIGMIIGLGILTYLLKKFNKK